MRLALLETAAGAAAFDWVGHSEPEPPKTAGAGVEHHHIQEPPLSSPAQRGRTRRAAV